MSNSLQSGERSIFREKNKYFLQPIPHPYIYIYMVNNINIRLDEHNMVEMSGRYLYLLPAFLLLSYIPSFVSILVITIQRY